MTAHTATRPTRRRGAARRVAPHSSERGRTDAGAAAIRGEAIAAAQEEATWCAACLEAPDEKCPVCVQQRQSAMRRFKRGKSVAAIAEELELHPLRVMVLLEEEVARLERIAIAKREPYNISNTEIIETFKKWQHETPGGNAVQELARRAGMGQTDVRRKLGLERTSDVKRGDTTHPGRFLTTLRRERAAQLLIGMGRTPALFEGL